MGFSFRGHCQIHGNFNGTTFHFVLDCKRLEFFGCNIWIHVRFSILLLFWHACLLAYVLKTIFCSFFHVSAWIIVIYNRISDYFGISSPKCLNTFGLYFYFHSKWMQPSSILYRPLSHHQIAQATHIFGHNIDRIDVHISIVSVYRWYSILYGTFSAMETFDNL